MVNIYSLLDVVALSNLSNTIIKDWVGPLLLAAIAVFAVVFIKDRAWMKLISFVGLAAVVAVLVYGGDAFFGESGIFKNTATSLGNEISSSGP